MSSQPDANPVRARRSNLNAGIEVAAETTTTITAARVTPKISPPERRLVRGERLSRLLVEGLEGSREGTNKAYLEACTGVVGGRMVETGSGVVVHAPVPSRPLAD